MCGVCALSMAKAERPNVILIMTDDQGYGDFECLGNPILTTPEMNKLHSESLRFTDFHVSPFCTPTRAALMTGHYPGRTGAYRTSSGRTTMHNDEVTVANVFADNGYVTGLVGKWHLGDSAPHRPQDRGFQEVLWHKAGGIGQGPDYWKNDYFDDVYERASAEDKQGKYEQFEGYCTDVWFDEAMQFVERHQDEPFFLYLAPNAPHGPYRVGTKWMEPFSDIEDHGERAFFGMIENLDYNLGLLRNKLDELELTENTILIYMTDNGTAKGQRVFNAGMKGRKSSTYDGGHRVPFFIHWPAGNLAEPQDIDKLAAHIDVLPTLADLCELELPKDYAFDGVSMKPLLEDPQAEAPRDTYFVQYHGGIGLKYPIEAWTLSVVATKQWRLMEGKVLYDMDNDPGQTKDVAAEHPEVVAELRQKYTPWWDSISPRMTPVYNDLGNPAQNPTELFAQDWLMPVGNPPYLQGHMRGLSDVVGPHYVNVVEAGKYRIALRHAPEVAEVKLQAIKARVEIAGISAEADIIPGSEEVVFELDLPAGQTKLLTYLTNAKGKTGGSTFIVVEKI